MGHVLVAGEHDVDVELGQQGEHVARVPDSVALSTGARHRHQVVVENEHLEVGQLGELLADPRVPLATDLAFRQVGLRGVDGHDLHGHRRAVAVAQPHDAIALLGHVADPERVPEVQVAHVLRIVVAGDHERRETALEQGIEEALGDAELGRVALSREVATDDDEVGIEPDRLLHRRLEQRGVEVRRPAVQVGQLGDDERFPCHHHRV